MQPPQAAARSRSPAAARTRPPGAVVHKVAAHPPPGTTPVVHKMPHRGAPAGQPRGYVVPPAAAVRVAPVTTAPHVARPAQRSPSRQPPQGAQAAQVVRPAPVPAAAHAAHVTPRASSEPRAPPRRAVDQAPTTAAPLQTRTPERTAPTSQERRRSPAPRSPSPAVAVAAAKTTTGRRNVPPSLQGHSGRGSQPRAGPAQEAERPDALAASSSATAGPFVPSATAALRDRRPSPLDDAVSELTDSVSGPRRSRSQPPAAGDAGTPRRSSSESKASRTPRRGPGGASPGATPQRKARRSGSADMAPPFMWQGSPAVSRSATPQRATPRRSASQPQQPSSDQRPASQRATPQGSTSRRPRAGSVSPKRARSASADRREGHGSQSGNRHAATPRESHIQRPAIAGPAPAPTWSGQRRVRGATPQRGTAVEATAAQEMYEPEETKTPRRRRTNVHGYVWEDAGGTNTCCGCCDERLALIVTLVIAVVGLAAAGVALALDRVVEGDAPVAALPMLAGGRPVGTDTASRLALESFSFGMRRSCVAEHCQWSSKAVGDAVTSCGRDGTITALLSWGAFAATIACGVVLLLVCGLLFAESFAVKGKALRHWPTGGVVPDHYALGTVQADPECWLNTSPTGWFLRIRRTKVTAGAAVAALVFAFLAAVATALRVWWWPQCGAICRHIEDEADRVAQESATPSAVDRGSCKYGAALYALAAQLLVCLLFAAVACLCLDHRPWRRRVVAAPQDDAKPEAEGQASAEGQDANQPMPDELSRAADQMGDLEPGPEHATAEMPPVPEALPTETEARPEALVAATEGEAQAPEEYATPRGTPERAERRHSSPGGVGSATATPPQDRRRGSSGTASSGHAVGTGLARQDTAPPGALAAASAPTVSAPEATAGGGETQRGAGLRSPRFRSPSPNAELRSAGTVSVSPPTQSIASPLGNGHAPLGHASPTMSSLIPDQGGAAVPRSPSVAAAEEYLHLRPGGPSASASPVVPSRRFSPPSHHLAPPAFSEPRHVDVPHNDTPALVAALSAASSVAVSPHRPPAPGSAQLSATPSVVVAPLTSAAIETEEWVARVGLSAEEHAARGTALLLRRYLRRWDLALGVHQFGLDVALRPPCEWGAAELAERADIAAAEQLRRRRLVAKFLRRVGAPGELSPPTPGSPFRSPLLQGPSPGGHDDSLGAISDSDSGDNVSAADMTTGQRRHRGRASPRAGHAAEARQQPPVSRSLDLLTPASAAASPVPVATVLDDDTYADTDLSEGGPRPEPRAVPRRALRRGTDASATDDVASMLSLLEAQQQEAGRNGQHEAPTYDGPTHDARSYDGPTASSVVPAGGAFYTCATADVSRVATDDDGDRDSLADHDAAREVEPEVAAPPSAFDAVRAQAHDALRYHEAVAKARLTGEDPPPVQTPFSSPEGSPDRSATKARPTPSANHSVEPTVEEAPPRPGSFPAASPSEPLALVPAEPAEPAAFRGAVLPQRSLFAAPNGHAPSPAASTASKGRPAGLFSHPAYRRHPPSPDPRRAAPGPMPGTMPPAHSDPTHTAMVPHRGPSVAATPAGQVGVGVSPGRAGTPSSPEDPWGVAEVQRRLALLATTMGKGREQPREGSVESNGYHVARGSGTPMTPADFV